MTELITNPNAWVALLTLTFLEIILGIDNIVFLSIVSGKLPEKEQPKARKIGLALAMVFRIILLFGITWVLSLQETLFHVNFGFFEAHVTFQGLTIFGEGTKRKSASGLSNAIIQIALLNIVFSFDSILTAIGMISMKSPEEGGFGPTGAIEIMILSVVISIAIMMIFAGPVSKFVNEHPTIQILGLSFLILIGVMLLAEGSHLAHFRFGNDVEVTSIPKGYLYFAIFFSLFVEFLNIKMRKNSNPVKLHNNEIKDDNLKDTDINN
jgi:predicted tellurium resistance membrane protein TerC